MSYLDDRRPLTIPPREPAHGKCHWIAHPLTMPNAEGVIGIGDSQYRVTPFFWQSGTFGLKGFRLEKAGTDTVYEVLVPFIYQGNTTGWTCDCKDAMWRRENLWGCKHAMALHALMTMRSVSF